MMVCEEHEGEEKRVKEVMVVGRKESKVIRKKGRRRQRAEIR